MYQYVYRKRCIPFKDREHNNKLVIPIIHRTDQAIVHTGILSITQYSDCMARKNN